MDRQEILLREWEEVRTSLRYFGNKRFAQLTVFAAVNAFLLDAPPGPPTGLHWLGLGLSIVFLWLEIGSVIYWRRFLARGKAIEEESTMPLELMTRYRPEKTGGTVVTLVLYLGLGAFWALQL